MNSNIIRRMFAALIDVMISAVPVVFCSIITNQTEGSVRSALQIIALLLTFTIILFKDYSGQSIGKRAMSIKIVDAVTRVTNKGRKNVVRNLLFVIWPIELALLLFSGSHRRWIDRALGLDVVSC